MTGDVTNDNMTGGESIYGKTMKDEAGGLKMKHVPGIVTMSNSGEKDTGNSQFMIVDRPMPQFDGKYVVVGGVISGEDVCHFVHEWGTMSEDGEPQKLCWISDCGEVGGKTAPKSVDGGPNRNHKYGGGGGGEKKPSSSSGSKGSGGSGHHGRKDKSPSRSSNDSKKSPRSKVRSPCSDFFFELFTDSTLSS